ncbi:MAG: hypothetical protein ACREKS_08125 [Candidatus Rokuibacteriota bacterium]
MRLSIDPSIVVLILLAVALAVVAYVKDPSLPMIGARGSVQMLWFVLPRMVPALILAGLLQVVIPTDLVARHFGREGGFKSIVIAGSSPGRRRMITWEAPRMGWPFVGVRVLSSIALPVLAGWLTSVFRND